MPHASAKKPAKKAGPKKPAAPKAKVAIVRTAIRGAGVLEYTVENPSSEKLLEHAYAIVRDGYRYNGTPGKVILYPPHRIEKVEIVWDGFEIVYPDRMLTP